VGTDESDDYYPSFISHFAPEHISHENNAKARTAQNLRAIKHLLKK
jgi:hypothetical protein